MKKSESDMCETVQILCARLKILALPPGQAAIPPGGAGAAPAQQGGAGRGALAPDILRGGWLPRSRQAQLLPRLKCATRCPAISSRPYDAHALGVALLIRATTGGTLGIVEADLMPA